MSKLRCYSCLELDRKLRPLQHQFKYLLTLLCPEIYLKVRTHTTMYLICWECEYMVNKIKRFQTRLRKANRILNLYVEGRAPIREGLSSLKQSEIEIITHTLPGTQAQNLPILSEKLPNGLKLPYNVLKLPSSDTLEELILIDPEIKIEKENEDSCINDFDELIKPTKIEKEESCMNEFDELIQPSKMQQALIPHEPLLLPSNKKPKITMKSAAINVPPSEPVIEEIVTPVINYVPQKVFINTPKQQVALRGLKETVKVTVGEPNFAVTGKESSVFVKKNDRRPGKRVLCSEVLPTTLKGELVIRPHDSISTINAEECRQSRGINEYQLDEAKLIILNKTELNELRRIKRTKQVYLGKLYKCRKCIERFHTQKKLDDHLLKHD